MIRQNHFKRTFSICSPTLLRGNTLLYHWWDTSDKRLPLASKTKHLSMLSAHRDKKNAVRATARKEIINHALVISVHLISKDSNFFLLNLAEVLTPVHPTCRLQLLLDQLAEKQQEIFGHNLPRACFCAEKYVADWSGVRSAQRRLCKEADLAPTAVSSWLFPLAFLIWSGGSRLLLWPSSLARPTHTGT